MHFLLLYALIIPFASTAVQRPDIYVWLEQNSYICDLELATMPNAMKFLTMEEAVMFKCECGDPLDTKSACARRPTEMPMCRQLPEICLREYMVLFTATENRLIQPIPPREAISEMTIMMIPMPAEMAPPMPPVTVATTPVTAAPTPATTPVPTMMPTTASTLAPTLMPTTPSTMPPAMHVAAVATTPVPAPPTMPPTPPPTAPPIPRRQTFNRVTSRPVFNRGRQQFRPNRPTFPLRSRPAGQRPLQRVFTLENRFPTTTPRSRTRNRRPFPTPRPFDPPREASRRQHFNSRDRVRERSNRPPPPRPRPSSRSRERSREFERRPRPLQRTFNLDAPREVRRKPALPSNEVFVPRRAPQRQFEAPPPVRVVPPQVFFDPPFLTTPRPTAAPRPATSPNLIFVTPSNTSPPARPSSTPKTNMVAPTTEPAVPIHREKEDNNELSTPDDQVNNVKHLIARLIKEMSGDEDPLNGLEKLLEKRKKERDAKTPSTTTIEPSTTEIITTTKALVSTTPDSVIDFLKRRIEQLESRLLTANQETQKTKRESSGITVSSPETAVETTTKASKNVDKTPVILHTLSKRQEDEQLKELKPEEIITKPEKTMKNIVSIDITEKKPLEPEPKVHEEKNQGDGNASNGGNKQSDKQDDDVEHKEVSEREKSEIRPESREVSLQDRLREIHKVAEKSIKELRRRNSEDNANSIEGIEKRTEPIAETQRVVSESEKIAGVKNEGNLAIARQDGEAKQTNTNESVQSEKKTNDKETDSAEILGHLEQKMESELEKEKENHQSEEKKDKTPELEENVNEEINKKEMTEVQEPSTETHTELHDNNLRDSVLPTVTPEPERRIYFTTSKFNAKVCEDNHPLCEYWTFYKQCGKNAAYMYKYCRKACGICEYRLRI